MRLIHWQQNSLVTQKMHEDKCGHILRSWTFFSLIVHEKKLIPLKKSVTYSDAVKKKGEIIEYGT